MRRLLAVLLLLLTPPAIAAVPVEQARVLHTYPHDRKAFTEGLLIRDGWLYESTGFENHSFIRKSVLATGKVVQSIAIPPQYFAKGSSIGGTRCAASSGTAARASSGTSARCARSGRGAIVAKAGR